MFKRSSSKSNAREADVPVVVKPQVVSVPAPAPTPAPVVPARPDSVRAEPGRCPHHRNKVLDLYCKIHKEMICSNCTVSRHHECHKHPSLYGESPFQPIEDAAQELQELVVSAMADEKSKEETIREALSRAVTTKEEIKKQVASLSVELESFRDLLIQEVNTWCEQHLQTLESVGDSKQENLLAQKEKLQTQIDALASHQRNILGTLNSAKGPEDIVPVSLRLLEKVSPIPELDNNELEPVEVPNLVFKQDGKDHLLTEIKGFGFTGSNDETVTATTPADSELFAFQ